MSKTQKEVRYWSPKIKSLVATFQEAQEMREASLRTIKTRLFQKFDENFEDWKDLVYRIAEIDCIVGLSNVRSCLGSVSCRPEFVQGQGVFEAENLRHPCLVDGVTRDFIPNDVTIGKDGNIILLTGYFYLI